jgi:hypothetical protein
MTTQLKGENIWRNTFIRKIHWYQIGTWKGIQHHYSLGTWETKAHLGSTLPLEHIKLKKNFDGEFGEYLDYLKHTSGGNIKLCWLCKIF